MKITKGNNSYDIPGWAVFVGLIVVDNIVGNICKTWSYSKKCNTLLEASTEDKTEES